MNRVDGSEMQRPGRSPFRRMFKNAGWGLGSRGFNSVVGIAYLAIAARTLGPTNFGIFVLLLTYGQMIANFVQFQSWKGVIRYGAMHVAANRPDRLKRLFGFTATLDFGSAFLGAVIALAGVSFAAPLFEWTQAQQDSAAIFAAVLLLTIGATPVGMLRLFDRFDLVAYAEAVGPLVRLGGSVAAWIMGADVRTFLFIWGGAAVAQALAQWFAAIVVAKARLSFGPRPFRIAVRENDRIWRFMLQTNVSNSVGLFWMQIGTLAIGAVAGAAEAGAFRLAQRLARGMMRPVRPVTLALYPELSRLVAEDQHAQLRMMTVRVTAVAAAIALLAVLVTGVAGREILSLLAGERFEFAYPFLFLLAISTAIDLAGFSFEPLQDAHGRSWTVLRTRLIGAASYAALLVVMLPWMGPQGAAVAAIVTSALIFLQLAWATARILRRPREASAFDKPDTPEQAEASRT